MKTNSQQTLLFSTTLPLPEAWRTRLRDIVTRIRPCLAAMETGQSRTIARISAKSPSVVIVKLSSQPGRCQAMALLGADTALLVGSGQVQVLHRGQSYEGSIEPTA